MAITNTSGAAGIAQWINAHYQLPAESHVEKSHAGIAKIARAIHREYDQGRTTSLADSEMEELVRKHIREIGSRGSGDS